MFTMKKVFKTALAASCLSAAAFALTCTTPAWAVHTGVPGLELDANTADDPNNPQDDWAAFIGGGKGSSTTASGIVHDSATLVFRKGSKDTNDVNTWHYDVGSVPPKNDILDAYCAAYNQSGDLVVYCGANRAVTNGTATTAFWFFGQTIQAVNGNFSGTHANGDTLIAVDHSNGGKVGTIAVYVWNNGSLQLVEKSSDLLQQAPGVFCMPPAGNIPGDTVCATTNPNTINIPWVGSTPPGAFIEVGINLSQVVPQLACVSSAMATDRASTSETAETKNFLLFPFPLCGIDVTKRCINPVLASPTQIQYTIEGKVSNKGFGTLSNVTLVDNPPAGTFQAFACDANGLPTGATTGNFPLASLGNTPACYRSTFLSNVNGPTDTVQATGSAAGITVSATAQATCPNLVASGDLTVTKQCQVVLEDAGNFIQLRVNYDGNVCVPATSDFAVTNIQVINNKPAANTLVKNVPSLAPGACDTYSGSYVPSAVEVAIAGQNPNNPLCAQFSDIITASGTGPAVLGSPTVTALPASATCKACPGGVCQP